MSRHPLLSPIDPPRADPCLKWAGSKQDLLPEILARIPSGFRAYREPFVGSGAVYLGMLRAGHLRGPAFLSDANEDLVNLYQQIQRDPGPLIPILQEHQRCHELEPEDYFLHQRRLLWPDDPVRAAARMLYLNRTGYNGLWRVNRKGEYNVSPQKAQFRFDADNLWALHGSLQLCTLGVLDFASAIDLAAPGDFLYLDPPYYPGNGTAFTAYVKEGFSQDRQEDLANALDAAAQRGVSWLLSQSSTLWVQDRFQAYEQFEVKVQERMGHRHHAATQRTELLVRHCGPAAC